MPNIIAPPAGFRKTVAVMLAGLVLAGTVVVPSARAADAPGEHIVNGDFEYPGASALGFTHADNRSWTGVERESGEYIATTSCSHAAPAVWKPIGNGFHTAEFGWDSSETDGPGSGCIGQRRANEVEIQYDVDGNIYAELCANEAGTSIRQTIATTPGAMYTVSLKHTSLTKDHTDSMRVIMVAKDGARTILPMTRVTSNGNGDQTGETSDIIATKASNKGLRDHKTQWETYQGVYKAVSDETTFTFESVSGRAPDLGNLLDDISFQTAYPLAYDGNGGTGALPERKD